MKSRRHRLRAKLWKLVSLYVRKRDAGHCITCTALKPINQMQAGHFFDKAVCNDAITFDLRNIHCQCPRCNMHLSGNKSVYSARMVRKYGAKILEELEAIKNTPSKWSLDKFESLIEYYESLLNGVSGMENEVYHEKT